MTYTKGPWYTKENRSSNYIAVQSDNRVPIIAMVIEDGGESVSNARLMASAPDLLEALEAIRARINGEWDNPALVKWGDLTTDTIVDILRNIDKPINKAKGV